MDKKDWKSGATDRRDTRHPQLSELSMNYEGHTEEILVRPPDLSPHGMFINTTREFPEGAVLKLRFRLSKSGIVIETRCEVRFCLKQLGVGVEFIDLSPENVQAIENEIAVLTHES
jgi:hypothetical protein